MSTTNIQPLMQIKDLTVSFSGFLAISNVSIDIAEGQIHVIIGPNGAGKSTLMDLITGKTKATSGSIYYKNQNIVNKSPGEIASKYRIGRKFQGPNVFDNMTVYENLEIALKGYTSIFKAVTYTRDNAIASKIEGILENIALTDKQDMVATELSHGERQWLEIGMVIAQSPDLIILDEPVAGMTDTETFKTGEMIKELAKKHTVVVIEHDMDFVEQIAEYVTVLHQGRKLAEGSFEDVKNNEKVIQVYLKDDLDEEGN